MEVPYHPIDKVFPCREVVGQAIPEDLREHVLRILQEHGGSARCTETNTIFTFPLGTVRRQADWPRTKHARYRIRFPDKYELYETCLGEKQGSLIAFPDHEFPKSLLRKYEHNWIHR